jgi:hypothetical protein
MNCSPIRRWSGRVSTLVCSIARFPAMASTTDWPGWSSLRPRIDLQVWVFVIPKVLDEPLDDLPIRRNPLLLCHAGGF